MKNAPLDYLMLGNTRIAATGVATVFGLPGTGKTSRAVLPLLTQFGKRLACAAPALYLSAHPDDASYDIQQVVVRSPRTDRAGAEEDAEWREHTINAISQFARSTEVYRALAIDAKILTLLGAEGVDALSEAINSASGSVSKFLLVTASSVNGLPAEIRSLLEKRANTRVFFTIADIDTMELVRTTLFPRRFWLPRRAYPRSLSTNGRYADAIIETEIGKDKESHLTRLPGTVRRSPSVEVQNHIEHFSR